MFGLYKAAKEITRAAMTFNSAIAGRIEMEGKMAENAYRASRGESMAYVERDFLDILEAMNDRERVINKL